MFELPGQQHARGVDQHVHVPHLGQGVRSHGPHQVVFAHVHPQRRQAAAGVHLGQLGASLLQPLYVEVGDDDVGSFPRQGPRKGPADPAGAARDERDLPEQLHRRTRF